MFKLYNSNVVPVFLYWFTPFKKIPWIQITIFWWEVQSVDNKMSVFSTAKVTEGYMRFNFSSWQTRWCVTPLSPLWSTVHWWRVPGLSLPCTLLKCLFWETVSTTLYFFKMFHLFWVHWNSAYPFFSYCVEINVKAQIKAIPQKQTSSRILL